MSADEKQTDHVVRDRLALVHRDGGAESHRKRESRKRSAAIRQRLQRGIALWCSLEEALGLLMVEHYGDRGVWTRRSGVRSEPQLRMQPRERRKER